MSDEQIKEEVNTSESPEESKESEAKVEETKETEGKHIDFQKLYEEEKTRREKAESIIQRNKDKKKQEDEPEMDYEPERLEEFKNEVNEKIERLTSTLLSNRISETIQRYAKNPDEAKIIRYHYENSIRPTGDVDFDIENALALTRGRRVESDLEEVKASLTSKETKSTGSGVGQKAQTKRDIDLNLSPTDKKIIDELRQNYVLSNEAIKSILDGQRLDDLIIKGVVKKRE